MFPIVLVITMTAMKSRFVNFETAIPATSEASTFFGRKRLLDGYLGRRLSFQKVSLHE